MTKPEENPENLVEFEKLTPEKAAFYKNSTATHDGFFKRMVSNVKRAGVILKWILPNEVGAEINWSELQQYSESFLDDDMKASFADAVFKVPIRASDPDGVKEEVPCYFFFILEHKSSNCYKTVFQILRYIVRIWEQDEKENKNNERRLLPFVFPIIFHNGQDPWTSPTVLSRIVVPIPGLEGFGPECRVHLVDLQSFSADVFPREENADIFLEAMKSIAVSNGNEYFDRLLQRMKDPEELRRPLGADDFYTLVCYICSKSKQINKSLLFKGQVNKMSSTIDCAEMMSAFELECAENLARGKAEGKAEGKIEGKLDALIRILTKRLGALPESTAAKIKSLDNLDDIDRLSDIALDVPSFDEFTKQLG